jgi:peptidoglycan/LPS O-acetylase OafA/YrhL
MYTMTELRVAMSRIPGIELLRVLATVGIFLFHLWSEIPLNSDSRILGPVLARLPLLGALGVIVFNCITGFVLSVPYRGQPNSRQLPGALDFFCSRFGRIGRHYYPTLVLWAIPWMILSIHEQGWLSILLAFVTHLVFLHTLHISTFFAIVPAFWWLGMLAQFYLVYPWLLRFFMRVGPGKACVLTCVICWGGWVILTRVASQFPWSTLATVHYLIYFNLPVRLPEFALGMWLAAGWNHKAPLVCGRQRATTTLSSMAVVIGPLLIGLILFILLHRALLDQISRPLDHIYLVCWCLCGMLAILRWPLTMQLGSSRLTLDLAAASYSIYLLHQPLLGYANYYLTGVLSPGVRFVVLLIGISWLCYRSAVGLNILVYRLART